ncbi:MAG: Flg hook protein, partial [Campylobacterota bacterium]|nr:Flg hook protein [Campylobacterota bacterium]
MIYFSMINLSTNKQLGIILANTNKALAVVLKESTPKEIETILKDKDLKSVINSLLKESAKSQEGDKALLNLVKNNPTLKDLGNITTTAKELLNALKSEKNPLPIETALRKFLVDVKELNEPVLKQKLENSGVFLESRPKNAQNPQVELKNLLVSLERSIEKSEIPSVKLVAQNIKELLKESAKSQERDKTLLNLAKNNPTLKVDNITSTVKELLNTLKSEKNPLPVETVLKKFLIDVKELSEPILKDKIQNSGIFLESRLKNVQNPQVELKNILVSLEKSIEKSEIPSVKLVAQNIKEILAAPAIKEATNSAILEPLRDEKPTLQQSPKEAKSPLADVAKRVEEIVLKLNEQLRSADVAVTKVFEKQLSKVEHLISQKMLTPENFKPAQLQEALQQLSTLSSQSLQLTQNANQEVKGVFDALVKIVEVLKVIQQENTMPKASLEVMAEKKVPEAVKTVVDVLRGVIEKADPLFSK